jgi:hypothetical protein
MQVLSHKLSLNIPTVLCPMCAKHMRFATFEPTTRDSRYRMTFDFGCGFKYQLSDAAAEVLRRNEEDISLALA